MRPADRLAWRTSSRSSNGENCVEVAPTADGVLIRHSKHPGAGMIEFGLLMWRRFMADALSGHVTNTVASISNDGADIVVKALHTAVELRFDTDEWLAFLAGVRNSEFGVTPLGVGPDQARAPEDGVSPTHLDARV